MSRIDFSKDRKARQARASNQADQDSALHAQAVVGPSKSPSIAQWDYLGGLARKLGYPTGRSLAADILHVANPAAMSLSSSEASRCIETAKARLNRQHGREEGEGGVRGGYG